MKKIQSNIQALLEQKQIHWGWLLMGGFLASIGGFIAIFSPFLVGIGISFFMGWMMIATGGYYFLYTIETREEGHVFRKTMMTILYVVAGLFMVMNPVVSLISLALLAGALFLVEGLTSLSMIFSRKVQSRRLWLVFSAAIEIGLGLYVLLGLPSASRWLVGTFWGVHMLILGSSLISAAIGLNRSNAAKPETKGAEALAA